ncbi:dTDP-glucose 4,6-dehydratase [Dissulfuribacter thermophilus]|uniref:dTDP-glucose 4,6-dehydratase n=1 Tax=Dissulfuribacter thermophilus TaxID=1156395 RepID=A0A1B9F4W7_9BACT|nr:dTDP-glucose 4,6-dehydratase [Dissulfuribacter thermophilus]OCC14865.1 dTDP-glucose 4,6-dehydratase [Dissulfuribacter thermophilus]
MYNTILVTGGAGFIGSNFIHLLIKERDWKVVNLDALTYAGNLENLSSLEGNPRYKFVHGRIEDKELVEEVMDGVDAVVHFAAESHVDRSIKDAQPFLVTNCIGTQTLLDVARKKGIKRFLHVSTDEVYGSLGPDDPPFREIDPLRPNSPYAASKASSDLLVRAAFKTHGMPVVITRCSNNYGPYQFPEKLIPLMTINAMNKRPLPIYGDGKNIRDWIHVEDHCRGVLAVLERGKIGEVYNLGGECEKQNIEIVNTILDILGAPKDLIQYVKDRPGHDRRYAMNIEKAKAELGWTPVISFEEGLRSTINWYMENKDWWERIISGEYRRYYEEHYGNL